LTSSTLGVLLPVPAPYGPELDGYRTALSGAVLETPAHITLVPPTDVPADTVPAVVEHLSAVAGACAPFAVRLRGTGTFRPTSPVVFVCVVAGISGCEELARQARSGPLHSTPRFPYHPHVTIAHGLSDAALDKAFDEQASFDAHWWVDGITLYENGSDGWGAVRRFPLGL
jgi:2'-5' RNA ligase